MKYVAPAVVAVALALPAVAAAHARLVRTEPADGAALATAPAVVRIVFDDEVRPAGGIEVVRNAGASVISGKPRLAAGGREVVVPLRRRLPPGDYSARWRVVSDDGHELSGVLAFSVGTGRHPAAPVLTAGSERGPRALIGRWLLFAGVLAAAGIGAFYLAVWRPALRAGRGAEDELATVAGRERTLFSGLHGAFLIAFLGAVTLAEGASGTRFSVVVDVAAAVSLAGALAAALGRQLPRLRVPAVAVALVLVALPSFAGHALDPGQPRLSVLADIVHLAAAAVWTGGLLALALVLIAGVGRLAGPIARRFSTVALGAVIVLGGTGVARALTELSAVEQLWTTGYGQALLVKTGLLVLLSGIGWANRYRLVPRLEPGRSNPGGARLGRLRRNVLTELGLLAVLVGAVAVLTDSPPGKQAVAAPRPTPLAQPPAPPPLPPADAVVLAGQTRDLAVALAARTAAPGRLGLAVTVLGQDGDGASGLSVVIDTGASAVEADPCGAGCYEASVPVARVPRVVAVHLSGPGRSPGAVSFALPSTWPPPRAGALVRRAARVYRALATLRYTERLSSRPGRSLVAHFRVQAPDRLAYRVVGGAAGVVVGLRRWDRLPGRRWIESPQDRLVVPSPPWRRVRDARLLGSDRIAGRAVWLASFLDPSVPAWFRIAVEKRTGRTLDLRMVAAAHFMHHTYSGFDEPLEIRPPVSSGS